MNNWIDRVGSRYVCDGSSRSANGEVVHTRALTRDAVVARQIEEHAEAWAAAIVEPPLAPTAV